MADLVEMNFKNARATLEEICEARLLVLKAELEAAEKQSDRITLYKNFADVMKKHEKLAHGSLRAHEERTLPSSRSKRGVWKDDIYVINRGLGVDDRFVYEGIRQVRDGEKVEYEFRPPDQILGHQ
jgi:hypothetical protein